MSVEQYIQSVTSSKQFTIGNVRFVYDRIQMIDDKNIRYIKPFIHIKEHYLSDIHKHDFQSVSTSKYITRKGYIWIAMNPLFRVTI